LADAVSIGSLFAEAGSFGHVPKTQKILQPLSSNPFAIRLLSGGRVFLILDWAGVSTCYIAFWSVVY
jgi:hypothetical protein